MSREIFQDLLEKYDKGLCTDAEKQIVEHWYGLLDAQDKVVAPDELAALEQKLWSKISGQIGQEESLWLFKRSKVREGFRKILAIAAIISLAITLLVLFKQPVQDRNAKFLAQDPQGLKTVYNTSSYSKRVELEDGSVVTLEPKARLTFPSHFKNALREVSLDGNGFFLISKNPKRPFLVYNKHIVTRVLGTSFSIKLNPITNATEVTVKTGKVLVTANRADAIVKVPAIFAKVRGVTLIPNEKTVYNVSDEEFNTTLADEPIPVVKHQESPELASSRFNDAPVKDVIAQLTDTYGIQIILASNDLQSVTFTGDLSSLNLYARLDFLCQSINAKYHVQGTRIIITRN